MDNDIWSFETLLRLTPNQINVLISRGVKFDASVDELLADPVMLVSVYVRTIEEHLPLEFIGDIARIAYEIINATCEGVALGALTHDQRLVLGERAGERNAFQLQPNNFEDDED